MFANILLRLIVVLTVLGGLAHQIHDRFEIHHHCAEAGECHTHHDEEEPADHGKACDHSLCCHSIVALVEGPARMPMRTWVDGGQVSVRSTHPPEVEPADIDHPPQLA